MQETRRNSVVETTADHDTKAFDELYQEIVNLEKKEKKTKQITIGLIGLVVGVLVTCAAWFGVSRYYAQQSPKPVPVPVDTVKVDSLSTDSLRLDSLRIHNLMNDVGCTMYDGAVLGDSITHNS